MISKGSLVMTPDCVATIDPTGGDVCVVISDPYPEWSGGHETVDLFVTRSGQVRSYYTHALKLLSQ
jgi:hypothetical protein